MDDFVQTRGEIIKEQSWILNHLAILLPQPILSVQPIKHGSLNHFPETPRETRDDHWHC